MKRWVGQLGARGKDEHVLVPSLSAEHAFGAWCCMVTVVATKQAICQALRMSIYDYRLLMDQGEIAGCVEASLSRSSASIPVPPRLTR
jgi:hypothetical protein